MVLQQPEQTTAAFFTYHDVCKVHPHCSRYQTSFLFMRQNLIQLKHKVQILKFTLQGKVGATVHFALQRTSAVSAALLCLVTPGAASQLGFMQDRRDWLWTSRQNGR